MEFLYTIYRPSQTKVKLKLVKKQLFENLFWVPFSSNCSSQLLYSSKFKQQNNTESRIGIIATDILFCHSFHPSTEWVESEIYWPIIGHPKLIFWITVAISVDKLLVYYSLPHLGC